LFMTAMGLPFVRACIRMRARQGSCLMRWSARAAGTRLVGRLARSGPRKQIAESDFDNMETLRIGLGWRRPTGYD
jgi:hypothetical protein